MLILKINLKKKKYYLNIFSNKKYKTRVTALPKAASFQDLRSVHFSAFLFFAAQVCWDSIIPSFD